MLMSLIQEHPVATIIVATVFCIALLYGLVRDGVGND